MNEKKWQPLPKKTIMYERSIESAVKLSSASSLLAGSIHDTGWFDDFPEDLADELHDAEHSLSKASAWMRKKTRELRGCK